MTSAQIDNLKDILARLKARDISQYAIAKHHGLQRSHITHLVKGTFNVGRGTEKKIILAVAIEAEKAGVPFDDSLFAEFLEPPFVKGGQRGDLKECEVHAGTVA